jgi:hypothetical protein
MGEATGLRSPDCRGHFGDCFARETCGLKYAVNAKQFRSRRIFTRSIVLMNSMHCDSRGIGPGSTGESGFPAVLAGVAHAKPVQGAKHDRLLPVGIENDTSCLERIVDPDYGCDEPEAKRASSRRGDVGLKGSHAGGGPNGESKKGAASHRAYVTC